MDNNKDDELKKIVSGICTILLFFALISVFYMFMTYSAGKAVYEFYQGISIGSSIDAAVRDAENRNFNISHSSEELKTKHSDLEGLIAVKSIFPNHFICFLAHKDNKVQAKQFWSVIYSEWIDRSKEDQ